MPHAMTCAASLRPPRGAGFLFPARPRPAGPRSVACRGLLDLFSRPTGQPVVALEEDAAGGALRAWLEQQGLPQQQVTVVDDPVCGRGLFASGPIARGSPAVSVPLQLALTPKAAARQLALAGLLAEHPLPAWSVLALWLAEARAAGSAHPWACYLNVLPARTGGVLEWTEEEVGWLHGSHLHQLATEIRSAAEATWEELQPLLAAAEQQGLAPNIAPNTTDEVYSRGAITWALSLLLSRLIRLPALGDVEAMVPWADFLNHDCRAEAFLDFDPASAAVVLRADRQYRAGEQVVVSYGQKTSGQLLLSYGFLPPPGSNPHDACLLPLELDERDPARQWKAEVLEGQGLASPQAFPLRMGALPQGLLQYAALAAARVGSHEEAHQLAAQLFGGSGSGIGGGGGGAALTGGSSELHCSALQAVLQQCRARLKAYAAPLDANKRELEGLQEQQQQSRAAAAAAGRSGSRGSEGQQPQQQQRCSRREQVLRVLVFEQQVLSRTVFLLQQQLRQLRRG